MLQNQNKKAFITGATGFIGQHLLNTLLKQNWSVTILTRNAKAVPEDWISRVKVVTGDLNDFDYAILNSETIVFHLAGEIKDKTKFHKTNVQGTKHLLQVCQKANIKKFIHLSSVGVMGTNKKGIVDENLPCKPRNEYEKSKYQAEQLVVNSGIKYRVLRPSIVYGSGKKVNSDTFLALIKSIRSCLFRQIGNKKSFYNVVYVQDVVNALIHLAKIEAKGTYIINNPIEWRVFQQNIQHLLNLKLKSRTIPKPIAWVAGLTGELLNNLKIRFPFNLTRYKTLTCPTIYSAEKIKQTQFDMSFSGQKGLECIIDYYKKENLI
ncbi:NAD-dependent epimerase/dehydratase family protein [Candidatus Kuenenbacteria bacterium]|nr:NAD-dependent epimerase/dehydratase family protein [Candidatus Kuenenbacteria bacterium]